jgi:hypothetical protein
MNQDPEDHQPGNPGPGRESLDRRFRVLPASRGMAWLITAWSLVRRQTWRLLTVAVLVQLMMSLTRFPVFGLIVALAIPILTAGVLQCFHHVRRGLPLSPVVLFSPFADTRLAARLFLLGGLIGLIAVVLISFMLSGVEELQDPELMAQLEQGDLQTVLSLDPSVVQRALLAVAVGVGVSGTLGYFTVPLIWFRKLPIGAALATGLKGLIRNWKPFLVLGLILAGLSIPLFLLLGLLVGLTAVSGGPGIIQYALFLLAVLVIQLLMFGTQYCAYAEIFGLAGSGTPDSEDPSRATDQLVA